MPRRATTVLLLIPALVYVLALVLPAVRGGVRYGWGDLVVGLVVLGYLGAAVALRGRSEATARLLLVTYALLLAFGAANLVLLLASPAATQGIWPRLRRTAELPAGVLPDTSGTIVFSIDSLGLRGREVSLDRTDVRVLCVGGSTTECLYVTDTLSWPWQLEEQLAATLGRSVFVGNAGRAGSLTPHHDYFLRHYALASRFQWVVVLTGINDLGAFLRHTYPKPRRLAQEVFWQPEAEPETPAEAAYWRLPFLARLRGLGAGERGPSVFQDPAASFVTAKRKERKARLARGALTAPPLGLDAALERYRGDLQRLCRLCRERGQGLLLVTQPSLWRDDLPPELEDLLWAYYDEGTYTPGTMGRMLGAFNRVLLEVAQSEGVPALDLAATLPQDTTVFYDDCHFNVSGCRRVAALIRDELAPRLRLLGPRGKD
jgi:lysophospholipase L1-like esterase